MGKFIGVDPQGSCEDDIHIKIQDGYLVIYTTHPQDHNDGTPWITNRITLTDAMVEMVAGYKAQLALDEALENSESML